jgi:hypothetical protein
MDCPDRCDASTTANAKKVLQQFLDKIKSNRRAPTPPLAQNSQWRQKGYPNQTAAQLITSITDTRTTHLQRQ